MALTTNILAYWKLDESSGNASDATGNGYTGANTSVTYAPEKINNGGVFNGSAYFDIGATNPFYAASATAFSWAGWVNITASSWGSSVTLLGDDATGDPNANHGFFVALDNRGGANSPTKGISFAVATATGGYYQAKSNNNVLLSTGLHYVVCTYASGVGHIYVDNTEGTSVVNSGSGNFVPRNAHLYLGALNDASLKMTGAQDEIGLWSRALSSTEASSLYNSGAGLQYPFTSTVNSGFFMAAAR